MEEEGQQQQLIHKVRNTDRISDLPDALIHHIMSFLGMTDIVRTSILSSRWRYLWLSTPYLDFDLDEWLIDHGFDVWGGYNVTGYSLSDLKDSFMDSVENILIRRQNTRSTLFKFRLYTFNFDFDFGLHCVQRWLKMCVKQNVQHLVLRFPLHVDLSSFFPDNLFSSNIRVLEISFVRKPVVQLPPISPNTMIKILNLYGVILPRGDCNGELYLHFPVVEDLDISLCDVSHLKALTVSAPLLEKLNLYLFVERKEGDKLTQKVKKDYNVKVKICTSQLKSLTLSTISSKHYFTVDYVIEDELSSLDSANLYICTNEYIDDESSQSLIKILQSVYNARALDLSICTKKVLTDFPVLLEGLPHQFQNLRCIKIRDRMKFPCGHAITKFLLSFPCIETLVWERDWKEWSGVTNEAEVLVANEIEAMKSNPLFQNMFDCLKRVEFHSLTGIEIESAFLAYILKRAILLEKIIIKFDQASSDDTGLESFKKTCLCLPRASPNASILFFGDN